MVDAAALDRWVDDSDFWGVVRVARGEHALYARARGLADRAHGIPNAIDTLFPIASGTKLLTALALLSLLGDGAAELDTPVVDVLDAAAELIDRRATLRQLLSHTSGMGDYLDESAIADIDDYVLDVPVHRLASPGDFVSLLRGRSPKFAPDASFAYCNSGYVLLALAIESLAGRSYYDVVQERVCTPADMQATLVPRLDELPGSAAIGYLPRRGFRSHLFHLPIRGGGDGGAYSTAADVARLWSALFDGRIVPPALLLEMQRPRHVSASGTRAYGLGLWLDGGVVYIEGSDPGISFHSRFEPATGLSSCVLSNTTRGAWPIATALEASWDELSALAADEARW